MITTNQRLKQPKTPNLTAPYLSIRNCVPVTGCSERMMRKMLADGELPHIKTGNRVLVNVRQLMEVLEAKTKT